MKPTLAFIALFLVFSSCVTPEKALEQGWYETALRLSANKIRDGKDVERNIRIMQTAADHIIDEELKAKKALVNSPKVKDWIKVQDSYYRVLEVLGKANVTANGAILTEYDEMCSTKKDLDFKIVEYFYSRGEKALQKFYDTGQKVNARTAYYEFAKAEKNGGDLYYNNLADIMDECHKNGIVYYIGDTYTVGSSFFLKPLPPNANFEPDCDIDIDYGLISFSESRSESSNTYTEEVVVGQEEVKDTSGNITYRDVIEEVEATITTVKVTVTASTWTSVNSSDLSGQCTVSSESFNSSVSDDYEEIIISGDSRAVPTGITEKTGAPVSFESELEDKLNSDVQSELHSMF